jgi:hypothetical protein
MPLVSVVLVGEPAIHRRVMGPIAARALDERIDRLPAAGTWQALAGVEPGTVDQLVAVASLCGARDADDHAAGLRAALAPGGRLLFLEHGGHGLVHRMSDRAYSASPFGCHVDVDVTGTLRRAGFLVTDLERCSMPSINPLLRPWAAGVAVVRGTKAGA